MYAVPFIFKATIVIFHAGSPSFRVRKSKFGERENFCLFCSKSVQKIIRHLERHHKGEAEVQKFLVLPKGSDARRAITTKLRLAGNHQHNVKAMNQKEGSLVIARRVESAETRAPADYVPCVNCLGYYAKETLYRHRCKVGDQNQKCN